jgi:hypothetical protein
MVTLSGTPASSHIEECIDELDQCLTSLQRFPEAVLAAALRVHLAGLLRALVDAQQCGRGEVRQFVLELEREALGVGDWTLSARIVKTRGAPQYGAEMSRRSVSRSPMPPGTRADPWTPDRAAQTWPLEGPFDSNFEKTERVARFYNEGLEALLHLDAIGTGFITLTERDGDQGGLTDADDHFRVAPRINKDISGPAEETRRCGIGAGRHAGLQRAAAHSAPAWMRL